MRRFSVAILASVALALGFAITPSAAGAATPPANDTSSGATAVSNLPFTDTVDTTAATTDADDAQVNSSCGAPATNNSIWYAVTAGTGITSIGVDTTGSSFSSGVIIASGTPGALTTLACSPIRTRATTTPGNTYYVLVFDDTGNGGTAHVTISGPAARPVNDEWRHAKSVTAIPYSDNVDTTGAATDRADAQVNASCGAPATNNSVWYKLVAPAGHPSIVVDGSASDFEVGFILATGTPGNLTTVSCGPFAIVAPVTAGTTYWLLAFDAFGNGGDLSFTIGDAPTVTIKTRPTGTVDGAGNIKLGYVYTCTNAQLLEVQNLAVQINGTRVAAGQGIGSPEQTRCDGAPHEFSMVVPPLIGKFLPGVAASITDALACGPSFCVGAQSEKVVTLSAGSTSGATAHRITALARRASAAGWKRPAVHYGH